MVKFIVKYVIIIYVTKFIETYLISKKFHLKMIDFEFFSNLIKTTLSKYDEYIFASLLYPKFSISNFGK